MRLHGALLAGNADDRTLDYLLLPFGEEGRTSRGRVTASAGTLELPEALVANLEHDRKKPVATGTVVERADGLYASFVIPDTTAGNDLLTEARLGLRCGISVELEDEVIRAGRLVAGRLVEAGFVRQPAFPSALLVASDYGETVDRSTSTTTTLADGTVVNETTDSTSTYEVTNPEAPADGTDEEENDNMGDSLTASAPVGGQAARVAAGGNKNAADKTSRNDLFRMLASAHRSGGTRGLTAALADIVPADIIGIEQPQFVHEFWSGKGYERRIIPLFNHDALTSFTVRGWRWVTKPTVAPYVGNKTAVPSAKVKTEQVDLPAERIAGAHDIDRKHRDFNDAEFFQAYFKAMTESYAEVSDAQVLADVLAVATPVTAGTIPAGAAQGLVQVVDGALAVLNSTRTSPTFGLVAMDLWRDVLLTPRDQILEYLSSSLGLEDGSSMGFRLMPAPELEAGQVLVGAKAAVTVHELGGPSPIRVEAENVANGGVDSGVFGYYATNVHDESGLALVTKSA